MRVPVTISYERRFFAGHTPFFGVQLNPVYRFVSGPILVTNDFEFGEGFNLGFISSNIGYQLEFNFLSLQFDLVVETPLNSNFGSLFRFGWGLGVSFNTK